MPLAAASQTSTGIPRIGYLAPGSRASHGPLFDGFRQELRGLGYVEGQNVAIEYRWADGHQDRLPRLADDLVSLKVDIIVTSGTPGVMAAKRATSTVPIVMAGVGDPVVSELVASLARPGGNVTGLSLLVPDIGGKRLQILKEIVPALSRVGMLWNAANPVGMEVVRATETGALALGLGFQRLEVRSAGDFEGAFQAARSGRASALLVMEDPLTVVHRKQLVDLAAQHRLPAMYGLKEFVLDGGLASYSADLADAYRRAAFFVEKILKGAKPAVLPVEQPTKVELAVNLKTARALGLEIPQALLLRAGSVIE